MLRALALAAALALGCGAGTGSPAGAVRALAEAGADGDRDQAWRLLGPATRARLQADAARAAEQSGRRALPASEMLAVGWFAPRFRPREVRELARAAERATVEVRGEHGELEVVSCVRVDGQWRVELP
jgi:hypothetical protein